MPTKDEIAAELKAANERIAALEAEAAERTETIDGVTPEEIAAWRDAAADLTAARDELARLKADHAGLQEAYAGTCEEWSKASKRLHEIEASFRLGGPVDQVTQEFCNVVRSFGGTIDRGRQALYRRAFARLMGG